MTLIAGNLNLNAVLHSQLHKSSFQGKLGYVREQNIFILPVTPIRILQIVFNIPGPGQAIGF